MSPAPAALDLDTPRYLSSLLCRIAQIEHATLKNWMRLPDPIILMGEHDRAASATGSVHLFTGRRLLQATITAELCRLGLGPRQAGTVSAFFTDGGGARRKPGELFAPPDETLLVVRSSTDFDAELIRSKAGQLSLGALFSNRKNPIAIVLNVNLIYERVLKGVSES